MSSKKQFAVIGLGRFGESVVNVLVENGFDVLAVDKNKEVVQKVSKIATHVIEADIREQEVLDKLGFNNFDVTIICIGNDMEASIMAIMKAKEKGVKSVVAKAQTQIQKDILEKIGADRVVLPEKEMGIKVATNLITTSVIDFITLSEKFAIAEVDPLNKWKGLSLIDSNVRAEAKLNVVAIKRMKNIIVSPSPYEIIEDGDILVVVGENKDIQNVMEVGKIDDTKS